MPFTGPLEDRLAIRELMNTHAHGVMLKDAEIWGSVWADDAYWELGSSIRSSTGADCSGAMAKSRSAVLKPVKSMPQSESKRASSSF